MSINAVDVIGMHGMVTSCNPIASRVGREILRQGGNAVDAAVATALALCVAQPSSNGIGGYGGTMVIYLADEKRVTVVDYNCRAPRAATPDMFELKDGWEANNPGQMPAVVNLANFYGPMACSVPGTVGGLSLAANHFGRLGWKKDIEPAIRLASDGFEVYPGLHANFHGFADNTDPESKAAMFPDGYIPKDGELWVQLDLAALLGVLRDDPQVFYTGEPGRIIADRVQSMGGILMEQDMADYQPDVREPLVLDYKGTTVYGSSSLSGGPTMMEALAVLQKLHPDPCSIDETGFWGDLAGVLTLAWQDRFAYIGDMPGIQEKLVELFSDEHAESLAKIVRSGKVEPYPTPPELHMETVHLCTCDSERNMVSLTETHGAGWGSRVGIPGLGIVIGHGMSRFDPRPDHPNCPGPYKKCMHNMSPVVLVKDGKPAGAFGLPGGRTIPSVMTHFMVGIIDFGCTPAEMLNRPRIHTEGGIMMVTNDLPMSARKEIEGMGLRIRSQEGIGGSASGLIVGEERIVGSAQAGSDASLGL
jgi:gamma-glutamyltranspeptidase/glutathione hydrolase